METFCISLDAHVKQWPEIEARFHAAGILHVKRVSGVLGKTVMASVWNQYRLKNTDMRRYELQYDTVGAIGCFQAHQGVWASMVSENIERAFICEEDVAFSANFLQRRAQAMAELPPTSTMCLLRCDTLGKQTAFSPNLWRIQHPFHSTAAYVLTLAGAKILLAWAQAPVEIHVDAFIGCVANIDATMEVYATRENLCGEIAHGSDVCHHQTATVIPLSRVFGIILISIVLVLFSISIAGNAWQYHYRRRGK